MALTADGMTSDRVVLAAITAAGECMHEAFAWTALANPLSDEFGAAGKSG